MGRDVGSIVGRNLAAYTAELGGKVSIITVVEILVLISLTFVGSSRRI